MIAKHRNFFFSYEQLLILNSQIQKIHAFIIQIKIRAGELKVVLEFSCGRRKMKKSWEYAERTKLMNPIDDEFFPR